MMIEPGWKVYQGMIVGEHTRDNDLEVNVLKGKKLTNIRAAGKDEAVRLTPPIRMTLEKALAWIDDDELVEVTPKSIRLRKAHPRSERPQAGRAAEGGGGRLKPAATLAGKGLRLGGKGLRLAGKGPLRPKLSGVQVRSASTTDGRTRGGADAARLVPLHTGTSRLQPFEQRRRQIAFGEGGDDRRRWSCRRMSGPRADFQRRGDGRAGRDADRNAFDAAPAARAVSNAVSLATVMTSSITARSRMSGHEAGADALDLVRARLAAGQHRANPPARPRSSSRDGLRAFSTWPTPVMVPPVPTPEMTIVDLAVGVVPDFLGRGAAMDLGIGRVLELLRDDRAGHVRRRAPGPGRWRRSCPSRPASAPARRPAAPASCAARSTSIPASPGSAGSPARRRRRPARCRCCRRSARSASVCRA